MKHCRVKFMNEMQQCCFCSSVQVSLIISDQVPTSVSRTNLTHHSGGSSFWRHDMDGSLWNLLAVTHQVHVGLIIFVAYRTSQNLCWVVPHFYKVSITQAVWGMSCQDDEVRPIPLCIIMQSLHRAPAFCLPLLIPHLQYSLNNDLDMLPATCWRIISTV